MMYIPQIPVAEFYINTYMSACVYHTETAWFHVIAIYTVLSSFLREHLRFSNGGIVYNIEYIKASDQYDYPSHDLEVY